MKTALYSFWIASLLLILPGAVLAESITVTVKGMVCSFCAQGIRKTFEKNPKVSKIAVDLDNKLVSIETEEGEILSDELIREIIADAGYDVLKIDRK